MQDIQCKKAGAQELFLAQVAKTDGNTFQGTPAPKAKSSAKAKAKSAPAKPLEPESPLQRAAAVLADVLKETSEAREFAMTLEGLEFPDNLVRQMQAHEEWMGKAYKVLRNMTIKKIDATGPYAKLFQEIFKWQEWLATRKQLAKTMQGALTKPKAKGKAKAKAEQEQPTDDGP